MDTIETPIRRSGTWILPLVVLVVGGVTMPYVYREAFKLGRDSRQWLTMKSIEIDLEGKEMILDMRTQKKTTADKMSKDDVVRAFWVSEVRRSQLEGDLAAIRQVLLQPSSMIEEGE